MKKFWQKFKNLRLWRLIGGALKSAFGACRRFFSFLGLHLKATLIVAACVLVAVGGCLALCLTLPVKSVEIEGEVILLQGEAYAGGLNVKATTRAGLVRRKDVLPDMIEGYDPAVTGDQEVIVAYGKWRVKATIKVLATTEVELRLREGSLPVSYEPNDPFPSTGVLDLYYRGERIRSAPLLLENAPEFTTRLSGKYDILLHYSGLNIPYAYTVLEIIAKIEPSGVLYAAQGAELSKQNVVGNLRFRVTYKDGTEEYVPIYDDRITIKEGAMLEVKETDYASSLTFIYKGVEVACPVTAYTGELLVPRSVALYLGRSVYLEGQTFDYAGTYLEVVYERFPDTPVRIRATTSEILLVENQGTPESPHYVPLTMAGEAVVFDEARSYIVMARYYEVDSAPMPVRAVSEEDAGRVTGLSTTWRGTPNGAPHKGQEPDVTDATLSVEYGFGYRVEVLPLTLDMVTGYDKAQAGDQTLHITYGEQVLDLTIRVSDPDSTEVTRIVALVGWNESTRYSDDALVVPKAAYLEVEIGYGGRENQRVFLKGNDEVEISGFTPKELAPQDLTISYCGLTYVLDGFTIVDDRTPEREYLSAPLALYVAKGEEFDLEAYTCRIGYNTEYVETLTIAELIEEGGSIIWTTSLDTNVPGSMAYFYLTLGDLRSGSVVVYVEGTVSAEPDGIRLDVTNAKTEYKIGESLDLTGMKLYLKYTDNSEKDITDELFADLFTYFDTTTVGNRTATVTYVSEEGGFATGYDYSVSA